ncbi:MAG TPA: stress protein [Cytophagales bacterium]|nr:stress protein [Cytophagales bacterium]
MSNPRRRFMPRMGATLVAAAAVADVNGQTTKRGKLIHHVFFWLANPNAQEDRAQLLEGLRSLGKIKTLRDFRIGIPAATEARDVIDSSYSFSLFTVFDDIAGHDAYQVDPVHTHFVDTYKHLWKKVTVYDVNDIG